VFVFAIDSKLSREDLVSRLKIVVINDLKDHEQRRIPLPGKKHNVQFQLAATAIQSPLQLNLFLVVNSILQRRPQTLRL